MSSCDENGTQALALLCVGVLRGPAPEKFSPKLFSSGNIVKVDAVLFSLTFKVIHIYALIAMSILCVMRCVG